MLEVDSVVYKTTRIRASRDRAGANRHGHANGIGRGISNPFRLGAADLVTLPTHRGIRQRRGGAREGVRATVPDLALSMRSTVVEAPRGRPAAEHVRDARVPCDPVVGYPSLTVMTPLLGGVQLLSLRVIGERLGRIFNETKRRSLYRDQLSRCRAKRVITHRSGSWSREGHARIRWRARQESNL